MKVIRWGPVAVTVLFALMNIGAAIDPQQAGWVRGVGAVLGVAGAVAAFGLARNLTWAARPSSRSAAPTSWARLRAWSSTRTATS